MSLNDSIKELIAKLNKNRVNQKAVLLAQQLKVSDLSEQLRKLVTQFEGLQFHLQGSMESPNYQGSPLVILQVSYKPTNQNVLTLQLPYWKQGLVNTYTDDELLSLIHEGLYKLANPQTRE